MIGIIYSISIPFPFLSHPPTSLASLLHLTFFPFSFPFFFHSYSTFLSSSLLFQLPSLQFSFHLFFHSLLPFFLLCFLPFLLLCLFIPPSPVLPSFPSSSASLFFLPDWLHLRYPPTFLLSLPASLTSLSFLPASLPSFFLPTFLPRITPFPPRLTKFFPTQ